MNVSDDQESKMLETFQVGPCKDDWEMGFLIGQRFSHLIRSRVARDLILRQQLFPFGISNQAQILIQSLSTANKYWDEMLGTAEGSGVSVLEILLLNFRKEILPFLPNAEAAPAEPTDDDCSDILLVSSSTAVAAHNEDANVALVGHTYLIKATLSDGQSFTAYTYAGEIPSCAFGFNSHGLAFTLNSVPPTTKEIVAGGIGRNFISRDLLEATSLADALERLRLSNPSVGHSYNLFDVRDRRMVSVETASGHRMSIREVGATPFFHANMYLHLQVEQVECENSIGRQRRAALLSAASEEDMLLLLGDSEDDKHPIYMTGPTVYTLCTVLINLDRRALSIIQGNPKKGEISHVFGLL